MMFFSALIAGSLLLVAVQVQGQVDNVVRATLEAANKYKYKISEENAVIRGGDSGHLDNCGDPSHNFTFQWSPKKFKVGDTVAINADFVAHSYIILATASITVWAKGVKDPIIKNDVQITCAQLKMFLPKQSCPLQNKDEISIKNLKLKVPSTYPIPAGTYIVKMDVHDQDAQQILCAKGEVQILDPPPVNWDDWRR